MSSNPSIALVDADVMVYRIGFASENDSESIARARLVEWFTDIVYIDLKCEDYRRGSPASLTTGMTLPRLFRTRATART